MVRAALVALAACSSPSPPAVDPRSHPPPPSIDVPRGATPVIDGQIDAAEWAGAATVAVGDLTLRFMHDRANVYIAVSRGEPIGFTCVFIAQPKEVQVLHASAKLGSAIYVANTTNTFDPKSKEYAWRDGETMQREEGWRASTVKMDAAPAQELAIATAKLAGPVAIGFFHNKPDAQDLAQAGTIVWPAGLADSVGNVQLVAGFNPDGQRFDVERWITLVPR